jgi:hypothetical protein
MDKAEKFKQTFQAAKALRAPHEDEIKQAFRFSHPAREFGKREGNKVDRSKLFDTTATLAVRSLVTNVIKLLVPQNRQWARISLRTPKLKEQLETALADRTMAWNDAINKHFLTSNFYLKMDESMVDAVVGGTACILFYDKVGEPLSYISVPIDQLSFTQDHNGEIDCVFREHELTGRQMISRFAAKMPKELLDTCVDSPDKPHTIIEGVIPRGDKFEYCVYLASNYECLEESTALYNPFIVWRWEKVLSETWGNSPVRDALPTIAMVNAMARDIAEAGNYAAKPCYKVGDDVINIENIQNNMRPGGVIAVSGEMVPLTTGTNFPITEAIIEKERNQIRAMMYANALMERSIDKTPMTATEASIRNDQFYSLIGEPALRLQRELLQPIAEQAVGRLMLRGEIEPLPAEFVQALGIPNAATQNDIFKVETSGAIQRAIKMGEAQNDLQIYTSFLQAGIDPAIISKHIDMDEMVRNALENFSFSPDAIRSRKDVAELEKKMQEMALQQQALGIAQANAGQKPRPPAQGGMPNAN